MIIPSGDEEVSFNFAEIGACHYLTKAESCVHHHIQKDHMLAYIYSGELSVHDGVNGQIFRGGTCVFIRKNHKIRFSIGSTAHEKIRIGFLVFNRKFLLEFYQQLDKSYLSGTNADFSDSFLSISNGIDIQSLFYSLVPYLNSATSPALNGMRLKLTEGIYALLNTNKLIAATLFDFIDPWKIDMLDFLNENYMYELTLEEIAQYTGRSLAAFKRDFKKVSDLTPMQWITNKRLEVAHQQLKSESRQVSDVYLCMGFKSLSHFSTAYKRKYGIAPTK
jgi:AraC-like DNA-binding protein